MRIVTFFLRWVSIFAVLAVVVYFFAGQMWIALLTGGFRTDLQTLRDGTSSLRQFHSRCQKAPAASALSTALALQMRFTDDTHYQIELRCSLIEDAPIVISSGSLPLLITKVPGSSGVYVDLQGPTTSSVTLRAFAAEKVFSVDTSDRFPGAMSVASAPATQCTGWGYRCCSPEQEYGQGSSQTDGVLDCASNCFSACAPLPYIQAFSSDPYPTTPGIVEMQSESMTVTFAYTATMLGGKVASVHIDYGDGQSDDSTLPIGAFTHTYTCSGPCSNKAVITAKDANGNSSVVNSTTTLYINRQ